MSRHVITLAEVRDMVGELSDAALHDAFSEAGKKRRLLPRKQCPSRYVIVGEVNGPGLLFGEIIRERSPRGVTLTERDLAELLEHGTIELEYEEAPSPTERFDALIGEARAAFDGPPSSEKWTLLVGALDRCHPDDLERLLAYIEPQLNRWDTMNMERWSGDSGGYMTRHGSRRWFEALPTEELRVAPPHWLLEMFSGAHSAKHRVTRVIELERLWVNVGLFKAFAEGAQLPHLTHLSVAAWDLSRSVRLFELLRTHELMRGVKRLAMTADMWEFRGAIEGLDGEGEDTFDALREVELRHTLLADDRRDTITQRFAQMERMSGVEITWRQLFADPLKSGEAS